MILCDDSKHGDIVHNENNWRNCPLCTALDQVEELKAKIEDLEYELKEANAQNEE